MHRNLKLILSSFTRQKSMDGCGAACLSTIFKYSGLNVSLPDALNNQPLSLRQLQEMAKEAGLKARAVQMDIENLRKAQFPCILHVFTEELTPHFIVYFAYEPKLALYLIGDPDGEVCYITETQLLRRWQSRAAVYFDHLPSKKNWRVGLYPWVNLYHFDFVPGILWIAVPFLNAFGTLLGLGATLVIEKAVSPQLLNGQVNLMVMIFTLLFSLSAAKCLINFFKERLIINFAGKLDSHLYLEFTDTIERSIFNTRLLNKRFSETIKDVQRIHQSASILIGGILCDGLMMAVMLICLYFYFPALVLPEAVVVIILLWITDRRLPFMLINYQSTQATIIPAINETAAVKKEDTEQLIDYGIEANSAFSRKSKRLSANANRLNFYFDAISSFNFLLVLAYTMGQLRLSIASYQEFIFGIILCYGIVATATKICNQLFLVAHGAEMLGRHKNVG